MIKQYELKINKAYKKLLLETDNFDAHDIRDELLGRNTKINLLLKIYDLNCLDIKNQIGKGFNQNTYSHYLTSKRYLEEFIKKQYKSKDINISKVDFSFANNFVIWLKENKCNNNGAIKHIKRALNFAVKSKR